MDKKQLPALLHLPPCWDKTSRRLLACGLRICCNDVTPIWV